MYRKILYGLLLAEMGMNVFALDFSQNDRELTLKTERLEAVVRDARIVQLRSRKTGQVFADGTLAEPSMTSGLGRMTGKEKELSKLHFPWGEPGMNQHIQIHGTDLYHHPDARSTFSVNRENDKVTAVWTGLTDGKQFFPGEKITLQFSGDARGALTYQASGESPDGGVFGVQIPLENFSRDGTFLLPTFGGLEYPGKGPRALMTFQHTTLFYEAPVMVYSLGDSSLGLWSEDADFHPFFAFFARDRKSCSFALEFQNLIPYEPLKKANPPAVKLDVFDNSGWIEAARPYRDWYHKTFASEMAKRDGIEWANRISVIVDSGSWQAPALAEIKKTMPADRVLIHIWQARKEGFTTNIPDYTPKANYPAEVKTFHEHGFKVMCYVCSLCAVYKSPAWERDNVGNFFLTRKNTITAYNAGKAAFDANLEGNITVARGKDQFASLKPGAFLYGDPLSKGWRDYFIRIIKEFNEKCGTDANYQDTLGCVGDVGNGIVDGLAAGQANAQFTRELLAAMPNTAMAAEFGPAPIGFGVHWPLNYAQVWGGRPFRESRLHRQRPLTPFLFGYRTWIPTVNAGDDFLRHVTAACSDALSGMGMFESSEKLQADHGFDGHLVLRSKVFADNGLVPYYPEKRYPENVPAMYRGKDGGIFRYYDDGSLQMMLDPAGNPLYGRLRGVAKVETSSLVLPGWPACDEKGIYGLNPQNSYALFPKKEQSQPTLLGTLPDSAYVRFYYETPDFAYLELGGKGTVTVKLNLPSRLKQLTVNDRPHSGSGISGELPLRIVLSSGKATKPDTVRKINLASGLEDGPGEELPKLRRTVGGETLYHISHYHAKSIDFMLPVENKDDAVEILFQNTQSQYGNGSIISLLVNGREFYSLDCRAPAPKGKPSVFDTKLRHLRVPLGQYTGQHVLVTLRVDNKNENNADMQWSTVPRLVKDPAQKQTVEEVDPAKLPAAAPPKPVPPKRPDGQPAAVLETGIPEGIYRPAAKHGLFISPKSIPVEPGTVYFLSGEFRKADKEGSTFYLGAICYDKDNRPIAGININPLADSETRLGKGGQVGDTKLDVMDASKWRIGGWIALGTELPNFDLIGPVENIVKQGGNYGVYLKTPLKKPLESDIQVRMHIPMGTYNYVASTRLSDSFEPYGGIFKPWPGTVRMQPLILSTTPVEIRNLKLEVFKK